MKKIYSVLAMALFVFMVSCGNSAQNDQSKVEGDEQAEQAIDQMIEESNEEGTPEAVTPAEVDSTKSNNMNEGTQMDEVEAPVDGQSQTNAE